MSKWSQFYAERINSTYQDYFNQKYVELLQLLAKYRTVREEGIGIGSVSKFLRSKGVQTTGFDLCPEMLHLCRLNNPGIECKQADIFSAVEPPVDMVVTHGVLEHFEDHDIHHILQRYKDQGQSSVHYVPLDGYVIPSFGDERLLPYEYWLDTFKPTSYHVKNNEDLIMIFEIL